MSSKRCGHPIARGKTCQRRVGPADDRCWQHRKNTKSIKVQRSGGRRSAGGRTPDPAPAGSSGARSARLPRPARSGTQGRITDDMQALRWLAERTRVHTAGNTAGLTAYQVLRNYHGIAALGKMTRVGSLPHGARAVFAGGTCLALGHRLVELLRRHRRRDHWLRGPRPRRARRGARCPHGCDGPGSINAPRPQTQARLVREAPSGVPAHDRIRHRHRPICRCRRWLRR